jgi:hypothetical protein
LAGLKQRGGKQEGGVLGVNREHGSDSSAVAATALLARVSFEYLKEIEVSFRFGFSILQSRKEREGVGIPGGSMRRASPASFAACSGKRFSSLPNLQL